MTVILLNGCTSAGKSSIAKALQDQLAKPCLLTGIDDAFQMIPARYHGHPEGFYFDRDDNDLVRLNLGEFGRMVLSAHQHAAAAMARSGVDLILDEVVLNAELRAGWRDTLQNLPVFQVGVHCQLEELERREVARGDRVIGQARGQFDLVHQGMMYDLSVDTTQSSTDTAVEQILAGLNASGLIS